MTHRALGAVRGGRCEATGLVGLQERTAKVYVVPTPSAAAVLGDLAIVGYKAVLPR